MKRKNMARNALFTSIISLLLCVSMLVGTTFAWFTDSVASGVNTIAAGNLDVELYHGKDANPVDKVDQSTLLFTDVGGNVIDQWEPGVVAFTNLKVANVGTLALKYQLSVNSTEVNYVTTAEGAQLSLADALKVAVVDGGVNGGNRAGVIAAGETAGWQGLQSFTKSDVLEGNETSQTYGIVIYWQPSDNSHDNLFNMNNDKVTSDGKPLKITLGVNLFATQEMYEDDSFGDDYDEGLILPDVDGEVLVEDNGIQYYYNENGDYVLYLVTEAITDTTLTIPEGVDAIGNYAFAYNSNVKEVVLPTTVRDLGRGFDSSSVKKVVLNEGLETISSRAFRSTPSLEEVVIPSTVTVIEDNAFQKSGIKNITIPATVKTIGETAFGSSQIETVTFEGNTSIQGYAFRGCSKLRTVNMNGDDVTFIASTLNNRNSTWFCHGESNNPNTSNITFNVVNETVATRVKTAMGAEAGNTPVYINGKLFNYTNVKNDNQLKAALDSGNGNITLAAGEYSMPSSSTNGDITITGTKDTVLDVTKGAYLENANVTIKGVTIKTSTDYVRDENGNKGADYAALYTPNVTYINCAFEGPMRVGRDGAKFINCTFSNLGNDYIWTYGNDVTFEDCTFNTDGKAILIYSDGGNEVAKVSVKNCTFNSTTGAKAGAIANQNCAAIEIHNYGNGVNLVTSGNTFDSNFSGVWRIKTYETGKPAIIVNGTTYTTIAIDGKIMTIDADKNVTVQ